MIDEQKLRELADTYAEAWKASFLAANPFHTVQVLDEDMVHISAGLSAAAAPLLALIEALERKSDQDDETIQWQAKRIADLTAQVELSVQPVTHQFQARDGTWHGFMGEGHMENTIKDGSWPIRALYTAPPKAVPLTEAQIEAAAKVLSHCMDYPWEHMPEAGRLNMRKNARTVIEAAICTPATVEKG